MCSISNALNGVIIYTGVVVIFIATRINVDYPSLPGWGVVERAGRNLLAFREGLGLLGEVMASCCIAWVGSTFVASLLTVACGRRGAGVSGVVVVCSTSVSVSACRVNWLMSSPDMVLPPR
jgi:hypothetical protein